MRLFQDLDEAYDEIGRDLKKGAIVESTRVQNLSIETLAHERFGYSAMIQGMPEGHTEFMAIWRKYNPGATAEQIEAMQGWLFQETYNRLYPVHGNFLGPAEKLHPALNKVQEGNHWSYTYSERLVGMIETISNTLARNPDSRRCFWPIFRPEDAFRASAPTRVPCTLGYDFMIRSINDVPHLLAFYLMRSSDYDTFLLSDLFLTSRIQREIARRLVSFPKFKYRDTLQVGGLIFFTASLHSFTVGGVEIY